MELGFRVIDTHLALVELVSALSQTDAVGVDLEADSMYHFRERVCLIQMAAPGVTAIVDPLKINDLSVLEPFFSDPAVTKIFHGADYDIRSLYRDFGIRINSLFDTEIACRFLGVKRTGLEKVVEQNFDVRLSKKFQKKDWSQRPLPEPMMAYAARDVAYLLKLRRLLERELERKGRLEWVKEECRILTGVRPPESNEEPLFLKFKGAGKLDRRTLAVLEALLTYRKRIARRKDRPLFKVMGNGSLMTIAAAKPVSIRQLANTRALSPRQMAMYGNNLVRAVKDALRLPQERLPGYPLRKRSRQNPRVAGRLKVLRQWRDKMADDLSLDPGLVFNKALLTAIAVKRPIIMDGLAGVDGIRQWQLEAFGRDIIDILSKVT